MQYTFRNTHTDVYINMFLNKRQLSMYTMNNEQEKKNKKKYLKKQYLKRLKKATRVKHY